MALIPSNNAKDLFVFCLCLFFLQGCSYSFSALERRRAEHEAKEQNYVAAVKHYRRVIIRSPESDVAIASAREAAKLSFYETKNFRDAIEFYKHLVKYSQVEAERKSAQKTIAQIFFEKLSDYPMAILEYNKLLLLRNTNADAIEYKFNLARSHYYLNHFFESQNETEEAIKLSEDPDKKFELRMFLASIYFNTKRLENALTVYRDLISENPKKAKAENITMNIIVCYEELEQFDKAILELEALRSAYPDPEFIDLKIKRLKDRKANQPGSRGLRK